MSVKKFNSERNEREGFVNLKMEGSKTANFNESPPSFQDKFWKRLREEESESDRLDAEALRADQQAMMRVKLREKTLMGPFRLAMDRHSE